MSMLKNTVITTTVTGIVTALVAIFFQVPLTNFVNNLFSDKPKTEATLTHDGYIRSFWVEEELSKTAFRVYPISLVLTNTGTVPFIIKSVIPYMIDTNTPSDPDVALLYNHHQDKFREAPLKPGDTEKIQTRAYIRGSFFAAGSTFPRGHTLKVDTEVKIIGSNKILKSARVRSLELTAEGIEIPDPKNELPVDFKEENPKAIWWK